MSNNDTVIRTILPNVADRSANKVIYMIVAESVDGPTKNDFYLTTKLDKQSLCLVIRGEQLSKAQAEKLGKENSITTAKTEIEVEIPWQKVKRIENLTFKKARKGEKNDTEINS